MLRAKSLQSCSFLCDPTDCSPPGSSVGGILQARTLEGVARPSSRGPSRPGGRTWAFCLRVNSLPLGYWESPVRTILVTIQMHSADIHNTRTHSKDDKEVKKEERSTFSATSRLHVVCAPSAEQRERRTGSSVTLVPGARARARARARPEGPHCWQRGGAETQGGALAPPWCPRVRGRRGLESPLGAASPP